MARVVSLGGRFFAPAEQTTSRQDGWIMVQLEDAGILALISKGASALNDESAVRSIVVQSMRSGKYHAIAAGLLVEDKEKWTPASAEQNAEFFAELTDEASKTFLRDTFTGMLTAFFRAAVPSSPPSATASPTPSARRRSGTRRATRSTASPAAVGPSAPGGSATATATA